MISAIGNALVMLCTYNVVIQLITRCQISRTTKFLHLYTMFLLTFELGIICYFMENYQTSTNNILLLILATGFMIVDAGVLYLFKIFSRNAILEMQTELAEQQCEMTVKYYECLQEQYDETQKRIHDFKRHLQVLEDLESGHMDIREKYISELMDSINRIQRQFKYEDVIVRTIIWEKIQICQQEGILLELSLQEIKFDFMEKSEVTSLFANLLDNAIEACRTSGKDTREISLRVHRYKDYIIIGMSNTIGSTPVLKERSLQSTKSGHLGMGMIILSNIAEKYCGNIDFSFSEKHFETKIIISAGEK